MRHAIIGVGGVGGLMAGALAHLGEDVTLIVRPETLATYPKSLRLESPFGNVEAPLKTAGAVNEAFDVVWITVKATQFDNALRAIVSADRVGAIVPLQNGVDHIAMLRSRFGAERVVPATISVESERVSPGKVVHRSSFAKLAVAESGRERLGGVLDKLSRFGFECEFVANEATLLWRKLVFLAPFALTTSAAGKPKGEIVADAEWRRRLEACVAEACAVAKARGADVDPTATLAAINNLAPAARSSMMKDVEAGNPPELDAIAGPIIRGGEALGIPVPVTRELAEKVRMRSASIPASR